MHGIARIVSESSEGYNVPKPIRNTITGDLDVLVYDWVSFFRSLGFKTVPNILSYHVFHFDAHNPTVVYLREYSTESEVPTTILKSMPTFDKTLLPSRIFPKGLDLDRQWYLYDKIHVLCHSNLSCDITCPEPSQSKAKGKTADPVDVTDSPSTSAADAEPPLRTGSKRCLCSICSNPGHNKKTCPSKNE